MRQEVKRTFELPKLVIAGLVAIATSGNAQESATNDNEGPSAEVRLGAFGAPRAGYTNEDGFGGPEVITAQLKRDDEERFYRIPIRVFAGWYDRKRRVNEKYGIQYNLNYVTTASWASEKSTPESEDFAAGGIATGLFSWQLVGRESGNVGRLNAKFESRHKFTDVTPMFLGFEAGYNSLTATGFRDYTPRIQELNWSQALANNRIHFVAGKVDASNYFTFHGLEVPWTDFLAYGFSVNGTVNWPDKGLGVIAAVRPTENLYITGALTDAQGDRFEDGEILCCGENFRNSRYFKALEFGYVPSFDERFLKKLSLTYWHTDEYQLADDPAAGISPEGEGWAVTAHWFFNDRIMPFTSYGKGDGVGANVFYEESFSIGSGFRFKTHDVMGVAFNWSRTGSDDLPEQKVIEAYYRLMLTEHLAVTPDVQLVWDPSLNPDLDFVAYFSLRLRLTF